MNRKATRKGSIALIAALSVGALGTLPLALEDASASYENYDPSSTQRKWKNYTLKATPKHIDDSIKTIDDVHMNNFDATLFKKTNEERVKRGLKPFKTTVELDDLADARAMEIQSKFSHDGFAGRTPGPVGKAGENIYMHPGLYAYMKYPELIDWDFSWHYAQPFEGYKSSKGHWDALMNPDYTHIGVSTYVNERGKITNAIVFAQYREEPTKGAPDKTETPLPKVIDPKEWSRNKKAVPDPLIEYLNKNKDTPPSKPETPKPEPKPEPKPTEKPVETPTEKPEPPKVDPPKEEPPVEQPPTEEPPVEEPPVKEDPTEEPPVENPPTEEPPVEEPPVDNPPTEEPSVEEPPSEEPPVEEEPPAEEQPSEDEFTVDENGVKAYPESKAQSGAFESSFSSNLTRDRFVMDDSGKVRDMSEVDSRAVKDLDPNDPNTKNILRAYEAGITRGFMKSDGVSFEPDADIERLDASVMLYRMYLAPEVDAPSASPFVDLSSDNPFYEAALWSDENQLIYANENNEFKPEGNLTRGEMTEVLWKAEGKPDYEPVDPYQDVDKDASYAPSSEWFRSEGSIEAWDTSDRLYPDANVTRGEFVSSLFVTDAPRKMAD